ncbi:MAG: FGGY-family carbohydrate kinase [Gammaproteobacteria bacterium]|nr:FGGY-family carbohydrate kinase [Gammaproteobacteria bacterium]
MTQFLGIDFGTSGCRSCVIDAQAQVLAEVHTALPVPRRKGPAVEQDPALWWQALTDNLDRLARQTPLDAVRALCLDGTSATLLGCDASGHPLSTALMYSDARAQDEADRIASVAPTDSAAHGATSSLAKLLWLLHAEPGRSISHALHQADWLLGRLCGRYGVSDENNALKLGYDIIQRRWPDWLDALNIPRALLPEVLPAGQPIGALLPAWAKRWGMPADTVILSGTTDSTASFIATGAGPGDAVSALGSTLVLKILTDKPVFSPQHGIYSHRLGQHWLAGGASNSGGAVLQQFFSTREITELTSALQPEVPTGLDYYPLVGTGERFPVNDPALQPRLAPRPADDALFFQGILEGIAHIEAEGYRKLAALGAPWPARILSTGGGAINRGWGEIRERIIGVPVVAAAHQQAAYGAALLALQYSKP